MPEFELPQQPSRPQLLHDVIFRYEHRNPQGELLASGEHRLDLVPNAGLAWMSSQLAGTVSGSAVFICLGTATANPTMGDLTLGGEITTSGLARQAATTSGVGAPTGLAAGATTNQTTGSFFVFTTFTASGNVTVNEAGVGQSVTQNAGIIAHDLLSPVATMGIGDTLAPSFQFIL